MCRDRLTLLHAGSGTGKISLLNAGLSPRVIREGRLPVSVRAYQETVPTIKQVRHWAPVLPEISGKTAGIKAPNFS